MKWGELLEIKKQVLAICDTLSNKKALDIVAIHVADKTIIADWFVIASGRSSQQVKALCDELEERAAEQGAQIKRKEGYAEGRWIVLDYSSILVHLFVPEERQYYNMERLWIDENGEQSEGVIKYSEQTGQ